MKVPLSPGDCDCPTSWSQCVRRALLVGDWGYSHRFEIAPCRLRFAFLGCPDGCLGDCAASFGILRLNGAFQVAFD